MKARWITEHRREFMTLGDYEIVVSGNSYNGWAMSCKNLELKDVDLSSKHFADAREEALRVVLEETEVLIDRYRDLRDRLVGVLEGEDQDD